MNLSLCRLYLELWHIFFSVFVWAPGKYWWCGETLYLLQKARYSLWCPTKFGRVLNIKTLKGLLEAAHKDENRIICMYGITSFIFTKEIYKHLKYFIIFACFSAYHYFNSNIPFPVSFLLSFSTKKDFHLFAIYSSKKDEKT